jgi:hypothetical protein
LQVFEHLAGHVRGLREVGIAFYPLEDGPHSTVCLLCGDFSSVSDVLEALHIVLDGVSTPEYDMFKNRALTANFVEAITETV